MRRFSGWLSWLFLGLVLTYTGVHWSVRVWPETVMVKLEGSSRAFMDFDVYHTAARRIVAQRDIYEATEIADDLPCLNDDPMEYIYTPLLALALTPLASLTPCTAEWIWLALNLALCLSAVPLMVFGLDLPRRPWVWGLAIGIVGAPMATLETLALGQANFVVLALMLGCVWLLRRGAVRRASVLLGLAACLKILPLMLGIVAARRGGKRAVVWVGGATLLSVVAAFALAPGSSYSGFLTAVQLRTVGGMALLNNASWVAAATRAYDLAPDTINWLSKLNMVLVAGVGIGAIRCCPAAAVHGWLPSLAFALAAAFTPVFQAHYMVLLYPALLTLTVAAVRHPHWPGRLVRVAGIVGFGILLNSRGLVPLHAADTLLEHLLVKPAWLGLWGVTIWLAAEVSGGVSPTHGVFAAATHTSIAPPKPGKSPR